MSTSASLVQTDEADGLEGESPIQDRAVYKRVKRVMWERVGINREKESLERAINEFDQIKGARLSRKSRNFVTLASLVAKAALWREESRGGHFRSDFPKTNEDWAFHSIQTKDRADVGSAKELDE